MTKESWADIEKAKNLYVPLTCHSLDLREIGKQHTFSCDEFGYRRNEFPTTHNKRIRKKA